MILWLALGAIHAARAGMSDRAVTLAAIHHLENPRNLTRPGPCGELGPYQFRRNTWRMYTKEPFHHALDRAASDRVAAQHYEWLKRRLQKAGVPPTTYNIALAWNAGADSVINGRAPRRARYYAERAVNLASTFSPANAVADAR